MIVEYNLIKFNKYDQIQQFISFHLLLLIGNFSPNMLTPYLAQIHLSMVNVHNCSYFLLYVYQVLQSKYVLTSKKSKAKHQLDLETSIFLLFFKMIHTREWGKKLRKIGDLCTKLLRVNRGQALRLRGEPNSRFFKRNP